MKKETIEMPEVLPRRRREVHLPTKPIPDDKQKKRRGVKHKHREQP